MDRREAIKWIAAASTLFPISSYPLKLIAGPRGDAAAAERYGTDPQVLKTYRPGDLWPLTMSPAQRITATRLCDLIIPADESSPSASDVGVVEFIDEWISAPYAEQRNDRRLILDGFNWLDAEAERTFGQRFSAAGTGQQAEICNRICLITAAPPDLVRPAEFFARFRDLTAGGFYTSPQGRADLQYVGNMPLASFTGPPPEVLRLAGLE